MDAPVVVVFVGLGGLAVSLAAEGAEVFVRVGVGAADGVRAVGVFRHFWLVLVFVNILGFVANG